MDPIKTQGYAQAVGFNPGTAPNTAEQQRRQDQEFIRQYKEAKQIELEQEATALSRIKKNNELERQNLGEYSRRKEEYQVQQDQIKLNQLQQEQKAQQQVAGMNSSDSKFNEAIDLVTKLSKTAFSVAGKFQDAENLKQTEAGTADANQDMLLGTQNQNALADYDQNNQAVVQNATAGLGAQQQANANTVIQMEQESAATQMGIAGYPDMEARLKGKNPLYKEAYLKAWAGNEGKTYAQTTLVELQQEQIDNPKKTYNIDGEDIAIGEIDLGKSELLKKVLQARVPEFLKSRGLEEYSSLGLGSFYKNAISSVDQVTGTIRSAEISEQKLDRQDKAKTIFQMEPTPLNAKFLYTTLTQSGLSNAAARKGMWQQWSQLPEAEFRAMGDMPFGPNGKSFREQYPSEWQDAVSARNDFIQSGRNNTRFAQEAADEEQLLQIQADYLKDVEEDGTFDADPSTLAQAADEAELAGRPKSAAALRAKIPLTRNKQYDKRFLDGLKSDIGVGIMNYNAQQIADNPSLSAEAKREALGLIQQYNETAVPKDISTADKSIINTAIRNRAGVNTFTKGPADMSVKVMEKKAWMRYQQVYKQEYDRTKSSTAASEAALADFKKSFGDNPEEGEYKVNGKITGTESGKYTNGVITGKAYDSGIKLNEVNINVEKNGPAAFTSPDLYTGEKEELTAMLEQSKSGKITVPLTLQRVQDNSGGTMSLRQLLNRRLKANGLDEIPAEVGELADEVEQSFDPRYNKYLNYKPSFIRTDIAVIGSGQDPIYRPTIPNEVANDEEFKAAVTSVSDRLEISPNDLYAVMGFETGGTYSPSIRNAAGSGATGLIQIMPSTAAGLGTTPEALASMSRARQMHYVEKHLRSVGIRPGASLSDLYMAVLFPAAVGKPDNFVLFGNGAIAGYEGKAYDQNKGLDADNSGSITKAEATAKVMQYREPDNQTSPWRQPKNIRPELLGAS